MTELAVAIVVLGIVLVGLFPLIVNSISQAGSNALVGEANRIVSSQLDIAQNGNIESVTCPAGPGKTVAISLPTSSKFAGNRVISCADAGQKLATVTINVWLKTDTSKALSTATTKVVTP